MTQEWINQKIKEAHETAIEKGFYECYGCNGKGTTHFDTHFGKEDLLCEECNGTGICRNIGELLMLIITELSEAVEAHRKNKFAEIKNYRKLEDYDFNYQNHKEGFEKYIKDTFEDEIADTFIRLFDLAGYMKINKFRKTYHLDFYQIKKSIPATIYNLIHFLPTQYDYEHLNQSITKDFVVLQISEFYFVLEKFCNQQNIDIQKHIELKMAYNKTRPHKHGKKY